MTESLFDREMRDSEARRGFEQERLILEATELISELMEHAGVTRAELAELMGSSRANITQLLSGSRNMTLRTLADLSYLLGHRMTLRSEPARDGEFLGSPVRATGSVRPRSIARVQDDERDSIDSSTDLDSRLAG